MSTILTPNLDPTTNLYNVGIAETYSWIPVECSTGRPLFARASYITNLKDLSVSFTASNITIPGGVELIDGDNSEIKATIVSLGAPNGTALKVVTQDLESSYDDIAIGDRDGNIAEVDATTKALKTLTVKNYGSYNSIHNNTGWSADHVQKPVYSFRKTDGTKIKLADYQLQAAKGIYVYEWRKGSVTGTPPAWVAIGNHGEYRIYPDSGSFTVGSSTLIASGLLNTNSHTNFFNPLTDNGTTNDDIWTLWIKRLDTNSAENLYFTLTLEEFN